MIPVVGGERDLVAVDDGVGTDVAHVARGVEWREVGALVLILLMLCLKETNSIKPQVKLTTSSGIVDLFQLQSCSPSTAMHNSVSTCHADNSSGRALAAAWDFVQAG